MTKSECYNAGMTLLSVQWQGFGWCIAVLLIAFALAEIFKLLFAGLSNLKRKPPPPQVKEPEKPAPEPVYYLVERKKKRPKKQYSEPKEISFR